LETLPDGSFRFRNVVVLVARQNGKSTLSIILSLWSCTCSARPLVIGTAQDLDVAEEIWQGAVDIVEETPELNDLKERVVKVNGKKSLELKTGERYKVKAANRRAGRGLSGDLILLDELREHQSWDAWGAITKTTMARADAQVWALSNAGDASSIVLRYLRKMAHAALGDPDGINAADDPAAAAGEDEAS
jgi:phage terminase large subunit-like protein